MQTLDAVTELIDSSTATGLLSSQLLVPKPQPGSSSSSSQLTLPHIPAPHSGDRSPTSRSEQASRGKKRDVKKRRRHPVAKVKGNWNPDEDARLVRLVEEYGEGTWSIIARHFPGRIGKQCRERWHNQLRPDIKRDAWTEGEEELLIELHQELGNRWADIAKRIPGRTENAVKNHWNATLRRKDNLQDKISGISAVLKEYMRSLHLTVGKRKRQPSRDDSASPVSWDEAGSGSDVRTDEPLQRPTRTFRCHSGRLLRPRLSLHRYSMRDMSHEYGCNDQEPCSSPYEDAGLLPFVLPTDLRPALMPRSSPCQLLDQQAVPASEARQVPASQSRPLQSPSKLESGLGAVHPAVQLERMEAPYQDFLACREIMGQQDLKAAEIDLFTQDKVCPEGPCLGEDLLCPSQHPLQMFEEDFSCHPANPRIISPILESTVLATPASKAAGSVPPLEDIFAMQNAMLQPWALRNIATMPGAPEEGTKPVDSGRTSPVNGAQSCTVVRPSGTVTRTFTCGRTAPQELAAARINKQEALAWSPGELALPCMPAAALLDMPRSCRTMIPLCGLPAEQHAAYAQLVGVHRPATRLPIPQGGLL